MSKVALLSPYAYPVPGGISTVVSGLRDLLEKHGHEVYVLAGQGDGDEEGHSNLGLGLRYVEGARSALKRLDVDVVHCHAHWYTLLAGLRYRNVKPDTRIVFSFHTTLLPRLKGVFARLLRGADVLTFVSAAQLMEIRDKLRLGGDLRILYPTVNLRETDNEKDLEFVSKFRLSAADPVLVFVGPLDYSGKVAGVLDLIRATDKLKKTLPRIRLLIVGDGKLRRRVEAVASGMKDTVTMTGFLEDPFPAFAASDIYCHISYQESFGIAVLEAMLTGCCIIATRTAGIAEILDRSTGVLIDPDPHQLTEAIDCLASDPKTRLELGARARECAIQSHTWDARWPRLSKIYDIS